ncbi:MAG: serine O-acetyltransferase [Methanobacteriaceae archaeon]
MFRRMREDIEMVHMRDPAARSTLEIFLCYPGLWAIWFHRFGHWLWNHNLLFLGRFTSTISRFFTGIEIHPAAQIGRRVFIDHGMGVVIGETAEVGNDVLLYQGVVLGGTSLERKKRHPTIGDGVVIGSGAKIIGDITIGNASKIGVGSVVLKPVPRSSTCVGIPGRVVQEERKCAIDLEHGQLPDPVAEAITILLRRQDEMERQIRDLGITSQIMKANGLMNKKSEMEEIFSEGSGI